MSDLFQRIGLRLNYELKKLSRKPFAKLLNPFEDPENRPTIIHCCYHKIGTHWFGRIYRSASAEYGMTFGAGVDYTSIKRYENEQDADFYLDLGSHVKLDTLPNYVGSHMVRDPRDVIISGYFYHKWANEPWNNLARAEYRGRSYKEHLNSLSQEEGLIEEIKRVSFWVPHMAKWNYNNPKMFEIKYEDIIKDEQPIFRAMFQHYGFSEKAVDRCCAIAEGFSVGRLKKKKKKNAKGGMHIRSGKTGEWQTVFKEEHKQLFKEMYPGALAKLGYEKDDNW